jgi:hypothetical protein
MPDTTARPWRRALGKLWAPVPWMLEAAIVLELVLRNFTEAGVIAALLDLVAALLAAGAAATAFAEALLRRRGRSSDIGGLITTVLAVSCIMTCFLGAGAGSSH